LQPGQCAEVRSGSIASVPRCPRCVRLCSNGLNRSRGRSPAGHDATPHGFPGIGQAHAPCSKARAWTGGDVGVRAAKKATTAIPIVFTSGSDPVAAGFVSLNRPGGNVTGVSLFISALEVEKLDLLRELVPTAAVIGFLLNPNNPRADVDTADMQAAARALGKQLVILKAGSENDFDAVLTNLAQQRVDALVVHTEPFFLSRRDHLVELAARHSIPTTYGLREFAAAGGLISYGTTF
jgi:putative tryptophan/tyrosine transport system substrate-binding protein